MFRAGLPSASSSLGLVLLGVIQMGIPSILYARGVMGVTAISCALLTMIEPVLNPVWVAVFYGEIPSSRAVAGGAIILFFVTLRTVLKARKI